MKNFLKCGLCLGVLFSATTANAAPSWSGNYEYDEDAGATAGGTPIFITHELKIWKGKKGYEARLESNGYQTYLNYICTAKSNGNGLNVYFSRADMQVPYFDGRPGDLMFRLEQTKMRGKTRLITVWKKFTPVALEKYPLRGVAFIRKTTKR